MDVAGPTFDRIGHDQVDQLDDGGLIGGLFQVGQSDLCLLRLQFDVSLVHIRHGLHDLL